METLAAVLFLLVTLCAFIAAPRFAAYLWGTLVVAVTVAAGGLYLLFAAPRDYLTRFPAIATILHPWLVALYVALALVVACGILLAFAGRYVQALWRRKDEVPTRPDA